MRNVDLNYLFHRQQVERSRADEADSASAKRAHCELASRYEDKISSVTKRNITFVAEQQ